MEIDWGIVITAIIALLGVFAGIKWQKAKSVLKETAEALTVLSEALQDNDVTTKELKKVAKEFSDVIIAAKQMVGK